MTVVQTGQVGQTVTVVIQQIQGGPRGLPGPAGAIDCKQILAGVDIPPNSLVNIYAVQGAFCVRLADASLGLAGKAMGFVPFGAAAGALATVYFSGNINGMTGLVPGDVFLSATPGVATQVAPTGSGQIVQVVGYATSESSCTFEPGEPFQRA